MYKKNYTSVFVVGKLKKKLAHIHKLKLEHIENNLSQRITIPNRRESCIFCALLNFNC